MYPCERCEYREAKKGEKYCKECRKIVIQEMKEEGYFRPVGDAHVGQRRTKEMKEKTHETKFGKYHG